jgi:predicted alpha/beta-fold hydrolase
MSSIVIPPFRPRRFLNGGHRQTLAGAFWPQQLPAEHAVVRWVSLPDGDALAIHDDCPPEWSPSGDPVALLLHGLAGCHRSAYLVKTAALLNRQGVRTFRIDLRGCGAGAGRALRPYNAGCSEDLLAVVESVCEWCPDSPITLLGFSLGGNITLKLLGEAPDRVPAAVVRAAAINPPIDLAACIAGLTRWPQRLYDRYFVKRLLLRVRELQRLRTDFVPPEFSRLPRRLVEFDDQFTAPRSGFRDADEYYRHCSSEQFLPAIRVPTLLLTSEDDPLVTVEPFRRVSLPTCVQLHIAAGGGHLGYLAVTDRESGWLPARLLDWMRVAR